MSLLPFAMALAALLAGCAAPGGITPTSGPIRAQVEQAAQAEIPAGAGVIQVVPVDGRVAQRLAARPGAPTFAEAFGEGGRDAAVAAPIAADTSVIGAGDLLEISIWEAPPAVLFGALGPTDVRGGLSSGRTATLPEQMVDRDGAVSVPFVGRIKAAGLTPAQLQDAIAGGLRGKANQPQAMVRVTRPTQALVTVVGDVATSVRMPLTPRGERVLDALAAAGGVRQPIGKTSIQLTRGDRAHSVPLDLLIREPRQNVALRAGDVVTAQLSPLHFSVLGATGRNEELPLEAQGISLAQALARAGGLNDNRADARGVFVFRLEDPAVLAGEAATSTRMRTPDGRVPVVYVVDLKDPASFFLAQSFPIAHRDVLYVANAPGAELQKFLNLLWGAALPALNVLNLTR
jgi:polysaccharide export outer membrane protein